MNEHMRGEHTFAICAYGESPYLEECILSILGQSIKSNVIMATSTPNALICGLAKKYAIKLYVNDGERGITQDWNFALGKVRTKYATLAHQDDVYEREYLRSTLRRIRQSPKCLIAFTDYFEIRDGRRVYQNRMAHIKRLMLLPLKIHNLAGSRLVRKVILSFGDPICCPSVTYCLDRLKRPIFRNRFQSCEDWEAWERIARGSGAFEYIGKALVGHRIHRDSTTSKTIMENAREKESYAMFCVFWPGWMARIINYFYTKSEKFNDS